MKTIAITRENGTVAEMILLDDTKLDESLTKWAAAVPGRAVVKFREVAPASLPSRRWDAAWEDDGIQVVVNIVKARIMRRIELAILRLQRIRDLSDQVEQAVDNSQTLLATSLRAKRKAARDLDLAVALAAVTDLTILDTFVPPELA